MAVFERVQRPFWMHQIVEYVLGICLLLTAAQQPNPRVVSLMGLLILINAAMAVGPAGAFRLVPRPLHRYTDLVVIGLLFFMAFQPHWSVDTTGRLVMFGVGFVMLFVWFYTDYSPPKPRTAKKLPASSEEVGRTAGRAVGQGVSSLKRWKDSLGSD
jgi:hypothetical protein